MTNIVNHVAVWTSIALIFIMGLAISFAYDDLAKQQNELEKRILVIETKLTVLCGQVY